MNERNAYEKHLADKLQSLPPPGDAKKNWPHMKALLDRDMPEAGRTPRGGKWWLFGSIIAVVITAGFLLRYTSGTDNTPIAQQATTSADANGAPNKEENKTPGGDHGHQQTVQPAGTDEQSKSSLNEIDEQKTLPDTNYANNPNYTNRTESIEQPGLVKEADRYKSNSPKTVTPDGKPAAAIIGNSDRPVVPKEKATASIISNKSRRVRETDTRKLIGHNTATTKNAGETSSGSFVKRTSQLQPANHRSSESFKSSGADNDSENDNEEASPEASNRSYSDRSDNGASIKASLLAGDSIRRDYPSIAVTNERSRFRMKTDRVKNLKNRVVGTGENKNLVVGLTFPLGFPLSDQRALAYNVNARANTISDFLPAPNIQYHFSQKSYFQAEVQFASPQFIEPALLSVKHYELGPGNYYRFVTSSVFARKLYYFNLPLEVHYSPFKNFYLGSGLQFSSLMSGVGYAEDRGSNSMGPQSRDSVFSQRYFKFRNDTLSSRLNGNEVRVLLDANYYWKKFTVGLRYNQAVNSYINIQVNNNLPPYSERNKTLQFYLRYNIWENRKK